MQLNVLLITNQTNLVTSLDRKDFQLFLTESSSLKVIFLRNRHGDPSSNSGLVWFGFMAHQPINLSGVSIYMRSMRLLITQLITVSSFFFISDLKIVCNNNY